MALNGSGGSGNNNNGEGRNPTKMAQVKLRKGPWTEEEDRILKEHVRVHGEGNWITCQTISRLMRCGKSCRLRWFNHLRPDLKKGAFSEAEEAKIASLHEQYGNKWSTIAFQLPGRSDNEIKNYWYTQKKRRERGHLPKHPNNVTSQQEQLVASSLLPSVVSSPKHEPHTIYAAEATLSIYDIFKTTSTSNPIANPNNSYNGLSDEQSGVANRQMQAAPLAELFAHMSAPATYENISAGDYSAFGIWGDPKGKGIAVETSMFADNVDGGSQIHTSIGPSYEQNCEAVSQMQAAPWAELFASLSAPTASGNIGAGGDENFGIQGGAKGKGISIDSLFFPDNAVGGSRFHASIGTSYEHYGVANSQVHSVPSAEMFGPMGLPTAFENLGPSGYVLTTPNEVVGGQETLGIPGDGKGKGIATECLPCTDGAVGGSHFYASIGEAFTNDFAGRTLTNDVACGNHFYASIGEAFTNELAGGALTNADESHIHPTIEKIRAALQKETKQAEERNQAGMDEEFQSLILTPLDDSMDDWFAEDANLLLNNDHLPNFGG